MEVTKRDLVGYFGGSTRAILAMNDDYALVGPYNTWDTNYHLFDANEDKEYLIDAFDLYDDPEDYSEEQLDCMLEYDVLLDLKEIGKIKEFVWKTCNIL